MDNLTGFNKTFIFDCLSKITDKIILENFVWIVLIWCLVYNLYDIKLLNDRIKKEELRFYEIDEKMESELSFIKDSIEKLNIWKQSQSEINNKIVSELKKVQIELQGKINLLFLKTEKIDEEYTYFEEKMNLNFLNISEVQCRNGLEIDKLRNNFYLTDKDKFQIENILKPISYSINHAKEMSKMEDSNVKKCGIYYSLSTPKTYMMWTETGNQILQISEFDIFLREYNIIKLKYFFDYYTPLLRNKIETELNTLMIGFVYKYMAEKLKEPRVFAFTSEKFDRRFEQTLDYEKPIRFLVDFLREEEYNILPIDMIETLLTQKARFLNNVEYSHDDIVDIFDEIFEMIEFINGND